VLFAAGFLRPGERDVVRRVRARVAPR
jgi:hypothetical protein